ncbi:MAG: OsmC family protein [Limisphaerales bacterium]
MSAHLAEVSWSRADQPFTDQRYGRGHRWRFDGGAEVAASASPHVVPVPLSDPAAVDPEEAFVASLASCHLLWFLALAAQAGFRVDAYTDRAEGVLGPDAAGRLAMLRVTLRPEVTFSGAKLPTEAEHAALHHAAHGRCFIANSVKTEVACEPVMKRA